MTDQELAAVSSSAQGGDAHKLRMRISACDTTANSGKQPVGLNRQQIVLRQLKIKPTLTIRPGFPRSASSSRASSC